MLARLSHPFASHLRILAVLLALLSCAFAAASRIEAAPAVPIGPAPGVLVMPMEAVVERAPRAGETVDVALVFSPQPGWHGYWRNPGDAGFGMTLDWALPEGWSAGEPEYPVPQTLVIDNLMNHVYEGEYAVIVPVAVPAGADIVPGQSIAVEARYLACTDEICVPQTARSVAALPGTDRAADPRFDEWRAALPPVLDAKATYAVEGQTLRVAIPLPEAQDLQSPHLFLGTDGVIDYAAPQTFRRGQDRLIVELALRQGASVPDNIEGILAFGPELGGVRFAGVPGAVSLAGTERVQAAAVVSGPALALVLLGALAGGALLNLLPCVFPILSLKALHLARAGESEAAARRDALAYGAGTLLATTALGAVLLALRAGGEQVGWAFQLQQPGTVLALLVLTGAITANLLGLFSLPGLSVDTGGSRLGSFATGLLAAFIATPCTGPFMAAALGAALVLPVGWALAVFACLGIGMALPFVLLGFVPALRRRLPAPGPWMERLRRWLALPMGLTALFFAWLAWRLGGLAFAGLGAALVLVLVALLAGIGRRQRSGKPALGGMGAAGLAAVLALAVVLPRYASAPESGTSSILEASAFSPEALAEARASGQPVFLYFTADWCLTCKVNERVAIERTATRDAFEEAGVQVLRGDWTRADPAITRYLESKGVAGVPLYVWIDADGRERVLDQVLGPDTLVDLARGQARPGSGR